MAVTDGGGTKMHLYSYDSIYQITEVNYPAGYDYLATDTAFTYDAVGNRTAVIDAGGTSSYVTNALNQYTSVGGATYVYDDSGNMTYDGANTYGYDPENRLTTVEKVPGPLSAACDIALEFTTGGDAEWFLQTAESNYDNDAARSGAIGDNQSTWLQTTVTGPGYLTFDYKLSAESGDALNLFIDGQYQFGRSGDKDWTESGPWQISGSGTHTIRWVFSKDGSGSAGSDCLWIDHVRWTGSLPDQEGWDEIEYTYDPSGRRIEKKVDGVTEVKYLYDGDHILAEYDANDTLLRKYVHGPCIDEPICMIEAAGSYAGTQYYHYDALGSVVALTNSAGTVTQFYEYSVYGQVAASDPNHPNRFMFTGREFDKDTGLYYYRARYYNPEIGRFLQTDPIGYGDGMNWHRYCGNNPVNGTDPSGLMSELEWLTSTTSENPTLYVLWDEGEWGQTLYTFSSGVNKYTGEVCNWTMIEQVANCLGISPSRFVPVELPGYGAGYLIQGPPENYYCPDLPTAGAVDYSYYANGGVLYSALETGVEPIPDPWPDFGASPFPNLRIDPTTGRPIPRGRFIIIGDGYPPIPEPDWWPWPEDHDDGFPWGSGVAPIIRRIIRGPGAPRYIILPPTRMGDGTTIGRRMRERMREDQLEDMWRHWLNHDHPYGCRCPWCRPPNLR